MRARLKWMAAAISTVNRRLPLFAIVIAFVALVAAGWSIYQPLAAQSETAVAQSDAKQLADPLDALCATDPSVRERVGVAGCQKAAEVKEQPMPTAAPVPGLPGVGIASVQTGDCSIRIALTDGRTSTLKNLCGPAGPGGRDAPAARGISSTTQDGCFVTVAYTDATSDRLGSFCGAAGDTGETGADGRTPPCLDEPTQCRGPQGDQGPQGWGLAEQRFVRLADDTCVSRATYNNPATGQVRVDDSPAGDNACPAAAGPTPDPPAPTAGG
jgi:hypothetical protein